MDDRTLNPVYELFDVNKQIVKAAERSAQIHLENVHIACGVAAFHCHVESPLEAVFLMWLVALQEARQDWGGLRLISQHALVVGGRSRRIDFILEPHNGNGLCDRASAAGVSWPGIAIELDGHDFHERTREQVIDRNERDRDLQLAGWTVFHFSGSEMHRDPEACLDQLMTFAMGRLVAYEKAIHAFEEQARG
jgi:hypothetical protein